MQACLSRSQEIWKLYSDTGSSFLLARTESFLGYYCAYGVFLPFLSAWLKSQQPMAKK